MGPGQPPPSTEPLPQPRCSLPSSCAGRPRDQYSTVYCIWCSSSHVLGRAHCPFPGRHLPHLREEEEVCAQVPGLGFLPGHGSALRFTVSCQMHVDIFPLGTAVQQGPVIPQPWGMPPAAALAGSSHRDVWNNHARPQPQRSAILSWPSRALATWSATRTWAVPALPPALWPALSPVCLQLGSQLLCVSPSAQPLFQLQGSLSVLMGHLSVTFW